MSAIETRIAEVLAASDSAHQFKKAEQMNTDYPHFWCSCGVQTIGRGKFPEHVRQASAAALASVVREAQASEPVGFVVVDIKTREIDWDCALHPTAEAAVESLTGLHQGWCRTPEEETEERAFYGTVYEILAVIR